MMISEVSDRKAFLHNGVQAPAGQIGSRTGHERQPGGLAMRSSQLLDLLARQTMKELLGCLRTVSGEMGGSPLSLRQFPC